MNLINLINFQNLVTGLLVAAVTGGIGYIVKALFILNGKFVFGSTPQIAGTYLSEYKGKDVPSDWGDETIVVKQFGRKIWGTISDKDSAYFVKFSGMVTPSRVIKYNFRHPEASNNDEGVGLLRLDKYGETAEGFVVFLDDDNENPTTNKIVLKKK